MKTPLFVGLVALVLVGACRTGGGTSPYPERVRLPSLDDPYVLPTESCGNFFLAETRINGRGPFTLLMDTGAGRTMLSPSVLDSADVRRGIDSLSIGGFSAFDLGYDRLDTKELSAALGREIHGLLGHPVFAGALVTWDFPANEIVITPGELPGAGDDILATKSDLRPFVRSRIGGTSRWVLIDTGSSRGLTLREPSRLALGSPLQTTGARARVDGIHLVRSGRLDGRARIGPIQIDDPVVSNSVSVDLVGQEVLRFFRLTFDQKNDRIRFERPDTAVGVPIQSAAVRSTGYALRPDTGWAEVIHVFGEDLPVRVQDRILAVDGQAWRDRSCPAPATGPAVDPTADTVDVRILREGRELTVRSPRYVVHTR